MEAIVAKSEMILLNQTMIMHNEKKQFAHFHCSGLDLHFGLPMEKAWRVARITRPTVIDRIDEFVTDPGNLDYGFIFKQYLRGGLGMKVATNPPWLQTIFVS
ncbi:hypothetical protein NECAME_06938 [Necator americanus]|uniref:Uncharacterized protein n=1 Tax=Necator americanus TaxID=51031 RepID=W2TQH4_NECAM|nr:hypothetical protein NECAME_06938 [Necator americanus]ETN84305.1 hypothetical protein NECAME_06938 [Necator americanus]